MLQRTPPFGMILKLLPARRAAFAHARQPMARRLARHSPNRRTPLKRGRTHANVLCSAKKPAPPLPGPATRFTTLNRRAAAPHRGHGKMADCACFPTTG
ncbi:hypothetical protein [Paraburkholderia susongensis]|uniref:Uncharacterized protein n=1 Tax=Paraburkholderia susongensis TaxID=1515439 RepID=A0A1X7K2X3_9BURK|nr:hypothetical protein [Paraburkholderia susongensis]SMG35319.1 hypothetical protein SAMN06265784_103325 [Paraburkholderia susongensis]